MFSQPTQSRLGELDVEKMSTVNKMITAGDRRVLPERWIPSPPTTSKASRGGGDRVHASGYTNRATSSCGVSGSDGIDKSNKPPQHQDNFRIPQVHCTQNRTALK